MDIGDLVSKNRSGDESLFEIIEFFAARSIEVLRNFFFDQLDQKSNYIQIVINKVIVEVGKSQECLYILDFL